MKISDLFRLKDAKRKSHFPSLWTPVTPDNNLYSSLDWDVEDCSSFENEDIISDRGKDIAQTKSNSKGDFDLVAKNCLLTAQRVVAIFDQLLDVNKKIDELKSLMENLISKSAKETDDNIHTLKSTFKMQ